MGASSIVRYTGDDFWKNYMERWFGAQLIDKWEEYTTEDWIPSNGRRMHLEVFDTGISDATAVVFAHGMAGYARVLLPFTVPLRERGYNVVAPDLQGYGYNEGVKGDFEWNAHVRNLGDAVEYARSRFSGKVVLGGGSMGGPLAYAAAARFGSADALVCWCLPDLCDRKFMEDITTTGRLTYASLPLLKAAARLVGGLRIRTYWMVSYDTLSDSAEMNELVKSDPQAGRYITLKGALSLLLDSKPDVPFEQWESPILVFQPEADLMTPAKYTKGVFQRLGSEEKRYVGLEGAAHFPTRKRYYEVWEREADEFLSGLR